MTVLAPLLSAPGEALVALDFDGTLAPIVPDPTQARALPETAGVLRALAPRVRALAVITGRPALTAVEYGGLRDVPNLTVLGQYGLERWSDGSLLTPPEHPGVAEVRAKLPLLLAKAPEGVAVEDKGHALAVHTRRAAEPDVALERLRSILEALAEKTGLVLEPGRFVLELRPPGMDKGRALTEFAHEVKAGSVLVAGDDLGDLAAFAAADALGIPAVKVCSGSDEVAALAAEADVVVDGPVGVVALLRQLSEEIS
ncbi:trehalose-phosphatase [Actinocorallia sp. API 0066]|uniref:trehalose-phosphatase n=1 Tax=Actinocorallia sp. API 0066 TaxID=2896846 RepID=UPI001E3F8336|nr:trehalose-phosphatase [Actinocorallia sp. API 0066]MCD0450225.1 trehalose-phosphatase [Actinocorallia sp. API 0066]